MYLTYESRVVGITVILGIIMVLWQALIGALAYHFQQLFFISAICISGIPHGALDHLIEQEFERREGNLFNGNVFLIKYLTFIVVYAVAWYVFPQFSLLAFLIMSGWHFGETDFQNIKNWPLATVLVRLIYGMSVLTWILFAHPTEAGNNIIHLIPANSLLLTGWFAGVAHITILLWGAGILILGTLTANQLNKKTTGNLLLTLQLAVILIGCYLLPLLPAFALYFAGWHSVVTLLNIERFLNAKQAANKSSSVLKLWIKVLPNTLITIAALLLIGFLLNLYKPLFNPLPLLFVFLSLITLPHMQVMHRLNWQP